MVVLPAPFGPIMQKMLPRFNIETYVFHGHHSVIGLSKRRYPDCKVTWIRHVNASPNG